MLDGDRLYLQLIHSGGAWVIALDKATGKSLEGRAQKRRPRRVRAFLRFADLWHNGKEAYLITHGNDYATAHRLEDGKRDLAGRRPQPQGQATTRRSASSPRPSPRPT